MSNLYSQRDTSDVFLNEAKEYQDQLNHEFADSIETPLTKKDWAEFTHLDFFPIDLKYRVVARFIRTPDEKPFEMATSTNRKPKYVKYAEAHFEIDGKKFTLSLYQSLRTPKTAGYENMLFLPFKDHTNGFGSYGGGRFMDVEIPDGKTIVLDFNKAYNPYCAYNHRYSCPIPPEENHLEIAIKAGVKDFGHH